MNCQTPILKSGNFHCVHQKGGIFDWGKKYNDFSLLSKDVNSERKKTERGFVEQKSGERGLGVRRSAV